MTVRRGRGMLPPMRARVWTALCSMVCALQSIACTGGTETGNPSFTGALSYTGYSSKPDVFGVREGGAVASIENAWLDLDTVKVAPEGGCGIDAGDAFEVPGLGAGDHAAGNHNSTPYAAKAGRFCSLELPFTRVPASSPMSGLPAELRGQSLLIVGKLADGTPFSITSAATPVVQLSADGAGFELSAEQNDTLLAFDFATWLEGIDFDAAEPTGDQILISESSNSELYATFEANLASGVALYRDSGGDGLLDPDAEPLAHAP